MAPQNPSTGTDEAVLQGNPVSNIPADRAEGVLSLLKLTPYEQPSSMGDLISSHHQTRLANAQMYSNAAKTALHSQLMIQHGIDPETGQRFDDPAYKGPSAEDQLAKYQANYNEAWTNYKKLAGVDQNTKGALAKAEQILNHILGGGAMQSAPGAPSNQGRPVGMAPPPQVGLSGNAGGPSQVEAAAPAITPPPRVSDVPSNPLAAPMIEANTQFEQGLNRSLQSEQAQFKQGIAQRKDVAENVLHLDPKSREYAYYVGTGKLPPVFRPPRPAGVYTVSVLDAVKRAQNGETFLDVNGNPIDVGNLDSSQGLKGMQVLDPDTNNWTVRYEPFSPNQATVTVGNEVYAVSPMDKSKLVTGAGTALGPHNVPTTSTHTAPGVTLGGEIGTVTTGTTRTPATVGITGGGTSTAAPTRGRIPPPPAPQGSVGQPGATRKSGAATVPITSTAPAPRGRGNEQAIPFGAANQLNQRIIPVREAATQLFGDPSQPEFKGFQEYASLADDKNKDERDALANAVRLTLDHMKGEERSAGSLYTLLGNYLGKPQALVDSETSVMKDVIGKLSPQNQEAYNAIMSVYGTVMGLRSLTRASSHQFSVEALEREIPLPGINAFSKQQFYDKMSRLAEQVYNGSKTVPLPKEEKDFYANKVQEYRKLAGGGRSSMPPPPTPEGSSKPSSSFKPF